MNRIVIKILLILTTALAFSFKAEAQIFKNSKRAKTQALLAIERQRTDSLTSVIEEYQKRESDWNAPLALMFSTTLRQQRKRKSSKRLDRKRGN